MSFAYLALQQLPGVGQNDICWEGGAQKVLPD